MRGGDVAKIEAAVAIVGAGPVGLSCALFLAARGVESVLIDENADVSADLRASTFHPPTLEMLDEIGLAQPLIDEGLVTPDWQIRMHESGAHVLFDLNLIAPDTRYPFRLQCEQKRLCAHGRAAVARHNLVAAHFDVRVTDVTQDDGGVTITLDNGDTVAARFAVGADGARSVVRDAAGIGFDGFTYPETTILATTRFPFHDHLAGLSNVNYCWASEGTFSLLRLPGLWRCSLYADAGEDIEAACTPAAIEAKLQRIVPRDAPYPVDEIRPYRIHQRIVDRYHTGRLALAGDAAHLNSPSGGMGMNGGIHDAFALAQALAGALSGGGHDALLARYERRRKPVAQEQILAQAHRNRTRMQERDPARRQAEFDRLTAITADPVQHRAYLLKSSMIEGLRQAAMVD
jgi:3-(3-hydroxy-phenyl)propionate hydroxylase